MPRVETDEFVEKIEKHRDEFFRFILRNVWDSGVAEDVFSTAVLAAYENRQKYTPGTNFRAWMFRIITNKCFVANRETGRAFERLDESTADLAALKNTPGYWELLDDPQRLFEECGDEVYLAFRSISTAQRTCILLRAVERFSYKEIAEILDMPVGTVVTHLARGRKKLREELLSYAKENGYVRTFPRLREREREDTGEDKAGSSVSP